MIYIKEANFDDIEKEYLSLRVMLKNGGYIHHEDDDKFYVRIRKMGI